MWKAELELRKAELDGHWEIWARERWGEAGMGRLGDWEMGRYGIWNWEGGHVGIEQICCLLNQIEKLLTIRFIHKKIVPPFGNGSSHGAKHSDSLFSPGAT
jgi:hypothetical protein